MKEMNKQSRRLMMEQSHWANPHGLANMLNKSSAYDVMLLCKETMKISLFRQIVKTKACSASIDRKEKSKILNWLNTNKLLQTNPDCIGIKTGITKPAGPCLASSFQYQRNLNQDPVELIIVVLNCKSFLFQISHFLGFSMKARFTDSEQLYNWTCENYDKLLETDQQVRSFY